MPEIRRRFTINSEISGLALVWAPSRARGVPTAVLHLYLGRPQKCGKLFTSPCSKTDSSSPWVHFPLLGRKEIRSPMPFGCAPRVHAFMPSLRFPSRLYVGRVRGLARLMPGTPSTIPISSCSSSTEHAAHLLGRDLRGTGMSTAQRISSSGLLPPPPLRTRCVLRHRWR